MVAMSEELGIDMEIRSLERMLQYGEQNIRRAVPLALGLLCISNPKVNTFVNLVLFHLLTEYLWWLYRVILVFNLFYFFSHNPR